MFIKRQQNPSGVNARRARGFSLFELVVFIISVAIIYSAAVRRFSDFPGEAERANFISVVTQLQTSINLEMMLALSRGMSQSVESFVRTNPMDLLLDAPSNYLGAFDFVDETVIGRRSWYYDLNREELVYLINDAENAFFVIDGRRIPTDEIRFRIEAKYRFDDSGSSRVGNGISPGTSPATTGRGSLSGLLLEPVVPYEWGTEIMELVGSGVVGT